MTANKKDPVLVVLQLSGAYDALNTVIPYEDPLYMDYRPVLKVEPEDVLPLDDKVGLNPAMAPVKELYDQGKVAVIQGIGYPNPIRSHFRSMDIWHTAVPEKMVTDGWLGKAIRELDPNKENVLTAVNFGRGLPRALAAPGVSVASVGNLETYGLLTGIPGEEDRNQALEVFSRMYAPAIGSGPVMDYIWETGRAALKGADILKVAPERYSSSVEYGNYAIGQSMRGIAQVHLAELGTRVLYTTSPYNAFDTHANEAGDHARLWQQVSESVSDFYDDLREHNQGDEVILLLFSEFGRRARDNGGGTDHGTGSVCFVIGDEVKGGLYGEYPSLKEGDLEDGGDLLHTVDFRSVYATMLERWIGLDPAPIVGGTFEQMDFL